MSIRRFDSTKNICIPIFVQRYSGFVVDNMQLPSNYHFIYLIWEDLKVKCIICKFLLFGNMYVCFSNYMY